MCKISEYPGLYTKIAELLRLKKIRSDVPGYELLKKAIIVYKIDGKMPKERFINKVKEGMVIPANKDLDPQKLKEKHRDLAMQWMIETLAISGIIPTNPREDVESILMSFVEEMSDML
ncbi:MAG: hypothetical protein GX682_02590 [Clostridiaceae bacterium]|nr:hypothetical protein [Clostridiaceae bacterium]